MENGTPKTIKSIARHEAAHFVTAWAVGCPASFADITPAARRPSKNSNNERVAYTSGFYPSSEVGLDDYSFNEILVSIAGPVADNWGQDGDRILENEKDKIDGALDSLVGNYEDDGDWYETLEELNKWRIDIKDPTKLKDALLWFIKALQEVLELCKTQWQELTEHLIKHGRINLNQGWWESGNDFRFIASWDGEDGLPPKAIRDCVKKYRLAVGALSNNVQTAPIRADIRTN